MPRCAGKYGISSVLSLVDDTLIEQMRQVPLRAGRRTVRGDRLDDEDARARRITAYLNLLDRWSGGRSPLAGLAVRAGKRNHALLRACCPTVRCRRVSRHARDRRRGRARCGNSGCARSATPGNIDVNIMSKGERDAYGDGEKLPKQFSDALAAL